MTFGEFGFSVIWGAVAAIIACIVLLKMYKNKNTPR